MIEVENLGKQYLLGKQAGTAERYRRLSEEVVTRTRRLLNFKTVDNSKKQTQQLFWALRNISFTVQQGDVIGIIGRNGAGKSTLLKLLSRITEPSEGRIRLRGRVSSLLEVGTGFHPELTGRENIFLNGSILGMKHDDIKRKFDEIVAFAEIEQFLDTPVKRYSSGMYVRLAFAVAAHLEPDILIVDEVLAVGDGLFQQKCIGKMAEVAQGGRTVLFVSHNLQAVASLCKSGIVLDRGKFAFKGAVQDAVAFYLRDSSADQACNYHAPVEKNHPYCRSIEINQQGQCAPEFLMHLPIRIDLRLDFSFEPEAIGTMLVTNAQGIVVCHSTEECSPEAEHIKRSVHRRCVIPENALNVGDYTLTIALSSRVGQEVYEKLQDIIHFKISFSGIGSEKVGNLPFRGVTSPALVQWISLEN